MHTVQRTLSQQDFDRFAALSGDSNPIHVNPAYAARARFGATVAHGMLLYAIFDGIACEALPGTIAVSQTLTFPAPTFADRPLLFSVRIDAASADEVRVTMTCRDGDTTTCAGEAVYHPAEVLP